MTLTTDPPDTEPQPHVDWLLERGFHRHPSQRWSFIQPDLSVDVAYIGVNQWRCHSDTPKGSYFGFGTSPETAFQHLISEMTATVTTLQTLGGDIMRTTGVM